MIEFFAAHKIALALGLAAIAVVVLMRHKGAAAAVMGYPVDPYSSTGPSRAEGGSLALPYLGPPPGSGAAASTGDAGGTAVSGPPSGSGPSVSDASTSTGPGAGPTMAEPVAVVDPGIPYVDPNPPTINDVPITITAAIGGTGYEQISPGSDYFVPVPPGEVDMGNVHTPGAQL